MALWEREYYFKVEKVDNTTKEYDYLTAKLHKMKLTSTQFYIVDAVTENRPDLISLNFFGGYHYGWLIGMHNGIEDLVHGFKIGTKLAIPSIEEYYRFHNRNTRTHNERK